jgi:methylated-DNA-[protein]-cysteine S-methyltransferase
VVTPCATARPPRGQTSSRIRRGTESYTQVAAAAGGPRAVRAVGTACATNPVPVIVPCHRVIRSDGSSGDYAGGRQAKLTLLRLEADAYCR